MTAIRKNNKTLGLSIHHDRHRYRLRLNNLKNQTLIVSLSVGIFFFLTLVLLLYFVLNNQDNFLLSDNHRIIASIRDDRKSNKIFLKYNDNLTNTFIVGENMRGTALTRISVGDLIKPFPKAEEYYNVGSSKRNMTPKETIISIDDEYINDSQKTSHKVNLLSRMINEYSYRNFPKYDSKDFEKECGNSKGWIPPYYDNDTHCTILAQLPHLGSEGLSDWSSRVVEGHLIALQYRCRFFIQYDYENSISLHPNILKSSLNSNNTPWWSKPESYVCSKDRNCLQSRTINTLQGSPAFNDFLSKHEYNNDNNKDRNATIAKNPNKKNKLIPNYRSLVVSKGLKSMKDVAFYHGNIRKFLPKFTLSKGFACSLSTLFQFNYDKYLKQKPESRRDENENENNHVNYTTKIILTLYIRTHHADNRIRYNMTAESNLEEYADKAKNAIRCAQEYEKRQLSRLPQQHASNATIIWLVITDSPYLQRWIIDKWDSSILVDRKNRRSVVTTKSQGIHSRPSSNPTEEVIYEAFMDWFLIGEFSDVVIVNHSSVSFGQTASLRTNRPIIHALGSSCVKVSQQIRDDPKWYEERERRIQKRNERKTASINQTKS